MSAVLETNVTAEGTFILRLDSDVFVPEQWSSKTPAERAEMIGKWAESHHDGVGLSDRAVSRESIYD